MTDDQLYREYLAGDDAAGDSLMLRYGDALTAYLNAFLHDPWDAEDLMLDCFTVLLVKKPSIGEGHFRAYLYKMARYKANRLWRLRLRKREFSLDQSLAFAGEAPEEAVQKRERNALLIRGMSRIAPQYREALWLVYGLEMSYAQAAEVLGCGVTRIENLLRNGKRHVRQELEREGITVADL